MKADAAAAQAGSLVVVGTGIKAVSHFSNETIIEMRNADIVLYLVADPVSAGWIEQNSRQSENLHRFYSTGKPRMETYEEMTEYILGKVEAGQRVCAAFYGHPGVFALPPHLSVHRARERNFPAVMLPGISAEDCLFADLGIDPVGGCQSFEATDFLIYDRIYDPRCHIVLWQIGILGHFDFQRSGYDSRNIGLIVDRLLRNYDGDQLVTVYEASLFPIGLPRMDVVRLGDLAEADINPHSTLYIPPKAASVADPEILRKIGIDFSTVDHIRKSRQLA